MESVETRLLTDLFGVGFAASFGVGRDPSPGAALGNPALAELQNLTGDPARPGVAPSRSLVDRVAAIGAVIGRLTGGTFDALEALVERSRFQTDLVRRGSTSCGGSTRLLATSDGLVALAVPREADRECLPALFESGQFESGQFESGQFESGFTAVSEGVVPDDAFWAAIESRLTARASGYWTQRARLLGLAMAELDEVRRPTPVDPAVRCFVQPPPGRAVSAAPVVVDLSSLWAGPLCTRILTSTGARVTKVEDVNRPDGARVGSPEFFEVLHRGQEFVQLDFRSKAGIAELRERLDSADVVIEASRPRALRNLGLTPEKFLDGGRVQTWLSITGFGREESVADRVAFGDDAAVAGGLVVREGTRTYFLGDAIADPLTGLVSACAVLQSLRSPDRHLFDVSLARVAAAFADHTSDVAAR